MNQQTDPHSKLVNVDLDQWRQEIDVFTKATASALDAIVSELSNACSGNPVPSVSQTSQTRTSATRNPIAKPSHSETAVKRAPASHALGSKTNLPTNGGSSRLASIKEKLASRINKG